MILPALNAAVYPWGTVAGPPVLLPPQYASPGHAKTWALDTKSCHFSNSFRGSVLCPKFFGITPSGISGSNYFSGQPEFQGSQIDLFYMLPGGPYSNLLVGYGYYGVIDNTTSPPTLGWAADTSAMLPPPANSDTWLNYPGPYPGNYPNRAPGDAYALTNAIGSIAPGYYGGYTISGNLWSYDLGQQVTLTGGHGSGAEGQVTAVGGGWPPTFTLAFGSTGLSELGTGYQVGDVLTIPGGDGSGRITVTALMYYPYPSYMMMSLVNPTDSYIWAPNVSIPLAPRTQQLVVSMWLDSGWGGWPVSGYSVVWGRQSSLPDGAAWPDVMSPDGVTLPFVGQWGATVNPETDWSGSSVAVARIPKPGYPYHT
jgi:hypothetical protein